MIWSPEMFILVASWFFSRLSYLEVERVMTKQGSSQELFPQRFSYPKLFQYQPSSTIRFLERMVY